MAIVDVLMSVDSSNDQPGSGCELWTNWDVYIWYIYGLPLYNVVEQPIHTEITVVVECHPLWEQWATIPVCCRLVICIKVWFHGWTLYTVTGCEMVSDLPRQTGRIVQWSHKVSEVSVSGKRMKKNN